MKKRNFYYIDPFGVTNRNDNIFNSWIIFYNKRLDKLPKNWKISTTTHPIQADSCNCGIFVIKFIEKIINNGHIDLFETSLSAMHSIRLEIANAIQNFKA